MCFHRIAEGQLQNGGSLRQVYADIVYNWFSAYANNNKYNNAVLAKRRQMHATQVNSPPDRLVLPKDTSAYVVHEHVKH